MVVNVVDAPMGAGKTNGAINMIKTGQPNMRYIYVTPYNDEIKRIHNALRNMRFCAPDEKKFGTKKRSFDYLVEQNCNIVTSHALFEQYLDAESFGLIASRNYILIMDEVSSPLTPMDICTTDANIMKPFVAANENGVVSWIQDGYPDKGVFGDIKTKIDTGNVVRFGDSQYVIRAPIRNYAAFKDIYILTYMFDNQIMRYYLDIFNCEYRHLYVHQNINHSYSINDEPADYGNIEKIRKLITVYEGKHNRIGDSKYALSVTWYSKHGEKDYKRIGNDCRCFFRQIGVEPHKTMWTTFTEYQGLAAPHGYLKGFLSYNMRATNAYSNRNAVGYLVNVFSHVKLKTYLSTLGVKIDDDKYALSEMLQFIWRSAIRNGEPINLYIPSSRMRGLLTDYLEGKIA